MSDVKRLLDAATPLPWQHMGPGPEPDGDQIWLVGNGHRYQFIAWTDASTQAAVDLKLAALAVNCLPDYEDALDALKVLDGDCTRTDPDYGTCFAPHDYKRPGHAEDPDPMGEWCPPCVARFALQPFREQVPA